MKEIEKSLNKKAAKICFKKQYLL
ncbi:hypothetical protein KsCSTR_31760 [Candidatus Kuenenia stuttgartiensis]|uniref:Uncharacterized protein n=1 Tax=Kuenenia stuttgartiensis TaxID=174633 RepID=A0A6G7GSS0_KUEST|nr:hypothetical protein KsCSTR_31760 [Candidatus Kuenenia stuttgartiensis]